MDENRNYSSDYEDDDDQRPTPDLEKSLRGYRIVIIILAVILTALSILYFSIHHQQQQDYEMLVVDRDSIQNNLSTLMDDFDDLKTNNDSISTSLGIERMKADSLMQRLQKERSWSYKKVKEYEHQVNLLKTVMKGYLRQIDSLNNLNKKLITENVSFRKEISTVKMRAEVAEEKAEELNNKVRQGSMLKARSISIVPLNSRSKGVSRVKTAARLRIDFTLAANNLTTPGNKNVYVRVTSPDGYVLSTEAIPTFDYEGDRLTYTASREVDYQNEDLAVGVYYNGSGFTAGKYTIQIYAEGYLIGSAEQVIK